MQRLRCSHLQTSCVVHERSATIAGSEDLSAAIETARRLYPDIEFVHSNFEDLSRVQAEAGEKLYRKRRADQPGDRRLVPWSIPVPPITLKRQKPAETRLHWSAYPSPGCICSRKR